MGSRRSLAGEDSARIGSPALAQAGCQQIDRHYYWARVQRCWKLSLGRARTHGIRLAQQRRARSLSSRWPSSADGSLGRGRGEVAAVAVEEGHPWSRRLTIRPAPGTCGRQAEPRGLVEFRAMDGSLLRRTGRGAVLIGSTPGAIPPRAFTRVRASENRGGQSW